MIGRTSAIALALSLGLAAGARAQQQASPEPGRFEIAPRGYVQLDWRGYPDWDIATGTGRLNRSPFEVRRARLGLDGQWKRVAFELTVDPRDNDGVTVKDAYAQARFTRAVRIRVGQFKVPGSREYGRSARTIDFIERAAAADVLAAGRDIGGEVWGEIGRRFAYEAGVFAGDGNGRGTRAKTTTAGRARYELTGDLDIAGSVSIGRVSPVETEDPNGLLGRSSAGYRFFDSVYVSGLRARVGADLTWTPGPWRFDVEMMRSDEQRKQQGLDFEDLPRLAGIGWSAAVRRELSRRNGGNRVRWRELELALRVDYLGFDDVGPRTESNSVRARATDVRPRSVLTTTAGVSWQPMAWTRVLTNASWEHYDETRSGPRPGRSGFLALATRLQVELP